MAIKISYVAKTDNNQPHEIIKEVGGINNNGTKWRFTQQQIINDIESGEYQYYVSVDNQPVRVIIGKAPSGAKYLKTEKDGEKPDNILDLPNFP